MQTWNEKSLSRCCLINIRHDWSWPKIQSDLRTNVTSYHHRPNSIHSQLPILTYGQSVFLSLLKVHLIRNMPSNLSLCRTMPIGTNLFLVSVSEKSVHRKMWWWRQWEIEWRVFYLNESISFVVRKKKDSIARSEVAFPIVHELARHPCMCPIFSSTFHLKIP